MSASQAALFWAQGAQNTAARSFNHCLNPCGFVSLCLSRPLVDSVERLVVFHQN